MFDKMRGAVEKSRLMARTNAHPNADTDAGHVRHFRRRDGQSILEPGYVIHIKTISDFVPTRIGAPQVPVLLPVRTSKLPKDNMGRQVREDPPHLTTHVNFDFDP